ncbi:hypothetical protein CKM354_000534800 [Cercospora kikuchii]|uniref:Nuclear pore complex protein Nup85 n=1 Tax=Cercospora kikuchii TaxID=84275 RepID=A0A9P3CFZ3_9PEZI|nr:uncharacterized protein CKM354_000534800 [Cercospora kikuchii]GIZ42068.1 hypothetical protein CKM354_000534800 [Cercospora kikuchii]
MSGFGPPSTPGRSVRTYQSTTPAGPPPTWLENTGKSTTPAGEPPRSSRFGRSSYNPTKSPNRYARKKSDFAVPDDDDEYSDEDAMGEDDDEYNFHQSAWSGRGERPAAPTPPRGLKRDAYGAVRENSGIAEVARNRTNNSRPAQLNEPEVVILQSERIVSSLDARARRRDVEGDVALVEAAADLSKTWKQHSDVKTKTGAIGPQSKEGFTKANYLASLLLQLHHPHTNTPKQQPGRLRNGSLPPLSHSTSVPRALLDWLETWHRPFPDDYDAIHLNEPSPSAHESFWDVVFANLLRGHTGRVIRLLKDAGWEHADSALDDGSSEPGYHGRQLDNIIAVMEDCIRVLDECPGSRYNNWDVKSMEWAVFRQRVRSSLDDLEEFAEGEDLGDSLNGQNVFQRSLASSLNMSTASRKASSKVPWTIYENLRLLYGLVLGQPDQILMTAQEWLEGALYLTIWWDGSDESDLDASVNQNHIKRAQHRAREVDVAPLAAYRRRLADAYLRVQDQVVEDDHGRQVPDAVFQPDTTDDVQLGLACIMEEQVDSVIRILRTFSMPVAVAVAEIAALGGWLPLARPGSRGGALSQGGLSKEDLLVLSYGAPEKGKDEIDRDGLLAEYADLLSGKSKVGEKEGWELAVSLLNRLDSISTANTKIGELLDRLQLTNEDTVDKVLDVCDELGQTEQRRNIAERYADNLAENTQSYGPALIYYARAHAKDKLKDTVSLLTSLSLLHSTAMPTSKNMDAKLSSLLSKNRTALTDLGHSDMEAAELLASHLSGYATLRKFYDLRDQDILATSERPLHGLERRRHAAASLFAVLRSAADCIPGGLFDPEAETIIPVEGLLALFGEALPFLGQDKRIFTQQQIFSLLAILEDFVAAPGRIRENSESLLSASLGAYRDEVNTGTGPFGKKGKAKRNGKEDLTKSVGSSWELLAESVALDPKKGEKIARAWDWRQGIVQGGIEGKEEEVVKLVREGLVREVASGWGGQINWQ